MNRVSGNGAGNPSGDLRKRVGRLLAAHRIWPVLALLMAVAAVASDGIFLRPSNLIAILLIAVPVGLAATGQTLVIITAGIDLSVASVWILSAVIGAGLASAGVTLPTAISAALAVGMATGLANGILIGILNVPPLITTLGMLSIGQGVARVITGNVPILSVPPSYNALGKGYFGPMPLMVLMLITGILAATFVMRRMSMGRRLHAVGGNPTASRYAGLNVSATLVFAYVASGFFAAMAGVLHSAYIQQASPNIDMTNLFAVIGGVVVGGAALTGGSGNVINSVGGVLVIVVVGNMMNILGVSPLLAQGVLGLIVLAAVYLNVGSSLEFLGLWLAPRKSGGAFDKPAIAKERER